MTDIFLIRLMFRLLRLNFNNRVTTYRVPGITNLRHCCIKMEKNILVPSEKIKLCGSAK